MSQIAQTSPITRWLLLAICMVLSACASVSKPDIVAGVADPYEGFNRKVFAFNDEVDKMLIKPVSKGYKAVVPGPIRECISNIFSNIGDVYNATNNLLQGKFQAAASDVCRMALNTTVGLFGCFDIATRVGLEKHQEDFGQTLAVWGVGAGPYIVLPFFGPSTIRDGAGLATQLYFDPTYQLRSIRMRNSVRALRIIDIRAQLLEASDLADDAALDRYKFYRDSYLQRRRYQIYDGDPPDDPPPKYEDDLVEAGKAAALPTEQKADKISVKTIQPMLEPAPTQLASMMTPNPIATLPAHVPMAGLRNQSDWLGILQ